MLTWTSNLWRSPKSVCRSGIETAGTVSSRAVRANQRCLPAGGGRQCFRCSAAKGAAPPPQPTIGSAVQSPYGLHATRHAKDGAVPSVTAESVHARDAVRYEGQVPDCGARPTDCMRGRRGRLCRGQRVQAAAAASIPGSQMTCMLAANSIQVGHTDRLLHELCTWIVTPTPEECGASFHRCRPVPSSAYLQRTGSQGARQAHA